MGLAGEEMGGKGKVCGVRMRVVAAVVKPRPGNGAGQRKRTGGGTIEGVGEQGADDRIGDGADDCSGSGSGVVAGEGTCKDAGVSA